MEQKDNAVQEFFKSLPSEDKKVADIFNEKEAPKVEASTEPEEEEVPESVKNRRFRRLEEKLQKEREGNIVLNERIKTLSEADRFSKEVEIDPRIARMFDTSDVGKENAMRLAEVLNDMTSKAKADALEEIEERQARSKQEEKELDSFIDNELEALEDQYNIDLTSDAPASRKVRREFLEMVQSLSPKDEDGEITGYADFGSTFDVYQKTRTEVKDSSRNKEIASKLMQRSGNNSVSERQTTPGFRGWEKDYNL